jgi:aminopeptidase N
LEQSPDRRLIIKSMFSALSFLLVILPLGASGPKRADADVSYDIAHYDIVIRPDFQSKQLSLRVGIAIDNPKLERDFLFDLNDRYESVTVTSDSSAVVTKRDSGSITVSVARPTKQFSLVFDLRGFPGKSRGEDRDVIEDQSLFLLWSDRFYPIDFNAWATVRTTIVLPPGFQAIAPGRLSGVRGVSGGTEHTFEAAKPVVGFSVFADSRWIRTERRMNGLQMQTLLYAESQQFAEQIFTTSHEVLTFYSQTYCPYPFEQFSFITLTGMGARRAFAGFVGYEPGYLKKELTTTGYDAHETALLWWGYTVRGKGPGSSQWAEGFGDYAEILYDEKYHKPVAKIFDYFREKYLATPAENDPLYSELRASTDQKFIHGKYPWLMHLVRYVVGDSRFKRAMKLVFVKFKYRAFTMDDFLAALEQGSGRSLRLFREEWLERRGVPDIRLKSDVQENRTGFLITCTLEQQGNFYHLPVDIGIETEKGMRIEKAHLKGMQTTISFKSKDKPKRVLLDPYDYVIMRKVQGSSKATS